MLQKLLYAVQAKAIEDIVTSSLAAQTDGGTVVVGSAGYREQVLPSLKQSGADILLYREDLKGSLDIFELMKSIRENFPEVRVVFIANGHQSTSKLLCSLVFLGIYDIINEKSIPPATIVDYILHPRNFGDVAKFFHTEYMDEYLPETPAEQPSSGGGHGKKGRFGGFLKGLGGIGPRQDGPAPAPAQEPARPAAAPVAVVQTPSVDMETMRGAMLEDARRQAQQELEKLVEDGVMLQTLSMKEELEQLRSTVSRLTIDLRDKTSSESSLKAQLAEARKVRRDAEERLVKFREDAELTAQQYQAQLTQLQTTKSADWYHEQTEKWLAERAHYKKLIAEQGQKITALSGELSAAQSAKAALEQELSEQERKIEGMALAVPRDVSGAIDATLEDDFVVIPDDESEYRQMPVGDGRVIAFMGTKHGTGNSTVALNTAVALANAGFKTCYIEVNRQFPMASGFFEFNNIALGLDTALAALQQDNITMASRCIIKPHALNPSNRNLKKIYNRLPGPLHFLLYSNDFINKARMGEAPCITEEDLKNLTYFLTVRERYSYVVVDIQPDDQNALNVFLTSAYRAHQLVMVMSQDPHGIKTAGMMITALARSRGSDLVRNTEFVVNQYSPRNKMTSSTICDILHIPAKRLSRISLDSEGYMNANYAMVPYVLSNGRNKQEYMDLRMRLGR